MRLTDRGGKSSRPRFLNWEKDAPNYYIGIVAILGKSAATHADGSIVNVQITTSNRHFLVYFPATSLPPVKRPSCGEQRASLPSQS